MIEQPIFETLPENYLRGEDKMCMDCADFSSQFDTRGVCTGPESPCFRRVVSVYQVCLKHRKPGDTA